MKNKNDIQEIERKLRKILAFEFRRNNYFPQHISDIREYLINELSQNETDDQVAISINEELKSKKFT